MKTAALREKVVIQAVKREHTLNVDSLHLPVHFDRGRLEMQLKMIGDVFGASPGNTVQDIAENMSKLQPQTRAVFKEAENPNCAYVSPSQLHHPREHFLLCAA